MEIKFSCLGFELLLVAELLLDLLGVKAPVMEGIAELPRGEPVEGFLSFSPAVLVGFNPLPKLKACSSEDCPPSCGTIYENKLWTALQRSAA